MKTGVIKTERLLCMALIIKALEENKKENTVN
jgi:hypothetical protein